MDEFERTPEKAKGLSGQDVSSPTITPSTAQIDQNPASTEYAEDAEYKRKNYRKWVKKPAEIGWDRLLELGLTLAIVYYAGIQAKIAKESSESSTKQIGSLIGAADRVDAAAESFSNSAAGIDKGVGDAVAKLQAQTEKMDKARESSQLDSSEALQATINDFRLDERPYLSIALTGTPGNLTLVADGIHKGQVVFGMPIQNFGKTPAIITGKDVHIAVGVEEAAKISFRTPTDRETFIVPPGDKQPIFIYSRVIAPNATAGSPVTMPNPMIVFGHVEYRSMFENGKQPYVLSFCSAITSDSNERERPKYCDGQNYIK